MQDTPTRLAHSRCRLALVAMALLLPGLLLAQTVEVPQSWRLVARQLQQKLPDVAIDRLVEGKRLEAGWEFRFGVTQQKAWGEEIIVTVKQKTASSSEYTVKGVRIDGGLFGSKREIQPALSEEWKGKIARLLEGVETTPAP
jgi:hypothetical protein